VSMQLDDHLTEYSVIKYALLYLASYLNLLVYSLFITVL